MALEVGNQALLQAIYDLAAMPVLIVSGGSVLVCSFGNLNYPNLSSLSCALVAEKCIKTRPFPTFSIVTPAISHLHPIISSSTHPPKKDNEEIVDDEHPCIHLNSHEFNMRNICKTNASEAWQKKSSRYWTLSYGINWAYAQDHGYEIDYVRATYPGKTGGGKNCHVPLYEWCLISKLHGL